MSTYELNLRTHTVPSKLLPIHATLLVEVSLGAEFNNERQ